MPTPKAPWEKKRPARKPVQKLTARQKKSAAARAKKAGRPYPNLVDNMNAAKKGKTTRKTPAKSKPKKK